MPQSPKWLILTGTYPFLAVMFANALPITVDLRCPIDIGLAMLGDDMSIVTLFPLPSLLLPKCDCSLRIKRKILPDVTGLSKKKLTYGPIATTFSKPV